MCLLLMLHNYKSSGRMSKKRTARTVECRGD